MERRWWWTAAGLLALAAIGTLVVVGRDGSLSRSTTCEDVEPGGTRFRSALPSPPGGATEPGDPGGNHEPEFRPLGADPVFCADLADPSVARIDDTIGSRVFVYGTNTDTAHVPVFIARSVLRSERIEDALPALPPWAAPGGTWAPSVHQIEDRLVMHYTVTERASGLQCISVATSQEAAGPFEDTSAGPLVCPRDQGGAIDPSVVETPDRGLFLLWKNDGNCCGSPVAIHAQPLTPDGLTVTGPARPLLTPTQPWEGSIVEAPAMVEHDGSYLLFYSANAWNSGDYAIGYATCDSPQGPCTKPLAGPWLSSSAEAAGPGGQDLLIDGDGHFRMVFHAWQPDRIGYDVGGFRSLYVVDLSIVDGAPTVSSRDGQVGG